MIERSGPYKREFFHEENKTPECVHVEIANRAQWRELFDRRHGKPSTLVAAAAAIAMSLT